MSELYTLAQMRELLRIAKQLGFADEIEHWENEIARAEELE
jgi:hypothetical protein